MNDQVSWNLVPGCCERSLHTVSWRYGVTDNKLPDLLRWLSQNIRNVSPDLSTHPTPMQLKADC